MKRSAVLALFAFLTLAFSASTASSYELWPQCGGSWPGAVPYRVNITGSDDVPFDEVVDIAAKSFAAWGEPCCSTARGEYRGPTNESIYTVTQDVVIYFEEDDWPQDFGEPDALFAITHNAPTANCKQTAAAITFNGANTTYTTNGVNDVRNLIGDLESIMVHEVGHIYGIGHSDAEGATMWPNILPGIEARSLAQDDIDGICTLYPSAGCECADMSDCLDGQVCINSACETERCDDRANPCPLGSLCNTDNGTCVEQTCNTDGECDPGFECDFGTCAVECKTCAPCERNSDCGSDSVCDNGSCLIFCDRDSDCGGNSNCYNLQTNEGLLGVCGQEQGLEWVCLPDYVCIGDVADTCAQDADCGDNTVCVSISGVRVCRDGVDQCAGIDCLDTQHCEVGQCVDDPVDVDPIEKPDPTDRDPNEDTEMEGSTDDVVVVIASTESESEGCATSGGLKSTWPLIVLAILFGRRRQLYCREPNNT